MLFLFFLSPVCDHPSSVHKAHLRDATKSCANNTNAVEKDTLQGIWRCAKETSHTLQNDPESSNILAAGPHTASIALGFSMVYHIIISLAHCRIFIALFYHSRLIVIPAYHYRWLTLSDWRHVLGTALPYHDHFIVIVTALSYQHKSSPIWQPHECHFCTISSGSYHDNVCHCHVVWICHIIISWYLSIQYNTLLHLQNSPLQKFIKTCYQTKINHGSRRAGSMFFSEQWAQNWFDISRSNIFIFCIDSLCCSSAKHHQDTVIPTLVI